MWRLYEYNYGMVRDFLFVIEIFECFVKMGEDQWMYDTVMFEKVYMNDQNEDEGGVNEEHVNCSDTFNTSQVWPLWIAGWWVRRRVDIGWVMMLLGNLAV